MKQVKTAIFGGSFDPPHYGHYDIVKNLEKLFDRVIVVPAGVSPFKAGAESGEYRLKLCKKLFTSDKTSVLSREVKRGGVSYSVETARFLHKKAVKNNEKLFWVIGSEELIRLDGWRDIDELKKLVTFFVVPRPSFAAPDDLLKKLKNRKIKIKFAKFTGLDISSIQIKIDRAFGVSNKFVPELVRAYAEKHGLFNPYGKYVDCLYKYKLSDKRLEHTYGVALRGAYLAKRYGVSVDEAVTACILHDVAKSVNPDDYKNVDVKGFPPPTIHGPIGAYIARREFGVSPQVEHAITYHSTGCGNPTVLDEVVYLADKTEMFRHYGEVYYFRYLCDIDKDYAMYAVLPAVADFCDRQYCEYGVQAAEYYKARMNGRALPEMPKAKRNKEEKKSTLPLVRQTGALGEIKSKSLTHIPDKSVAVPTVKDVAEVKPEREQTGETEYSKIAETVAAELALHKAQDVVIIDLAGKTIVADYFVIASASSTTAVKALYGYVEDKLTKDFGLDPTKRDIDSEWVALDYGSVIVHIFTHKTREFYNIERLWADGDNVKRVGD